MGGSLMQLVAVGAQDVPLIGNPQMTYFKSVVKRYTHFAVESISMPFDQVANFGKKVTCLIDKKGDLVSDAVIQINLPALSSGVSWINGIGNNMIQKVELEIGGTIVDTIQGTFLDIHPEICLDEPKFDAYKRMTGKRDDFTKYSQEGALTLYVPLPFWFCKDYGRALPLVALQYHDVKINVYFRPFSQVWYSGTAMGTTPSDTDILDARLYCEYVFLDTKERRYFATSNHSYLIEQHQHCLQNPVTAGSTQSRADLMFNLPVKELLWVYQANDVSLANDWGNYSNTLDDDQAPVTPVEPITEVCLRINGYERFEPREGSYFRLVQPYRHFKRASYGFIYCYSFSLNPCRSQPSGSLDFSWLNSTVMDFKHPSDIKTGTVKVFAVNYNFLLVAKGMGSVLYQS